MNLWQLTPDPSREPHPLIPGERLKLVIGTSPIEPGQRVWVIYRVNDDADLRCDAIWDRNEDANSYWHAELGPFARGGRVRYTLCGSSREGEVTGPRSEFRVGPRLYLALLWHQHQPIYKDGSAPVPRGSYLQPWVRLHSVRDYYSMAALVAEHPDVHLTINLTPALLWQIEDYIERGATDRALELTLKPAGKLSSAEREEILSTFFDADWHHQIFPHPRYKELFLQRVEGQPFTVQDLRDVQMWFNLAWFAAEFREREVRLPPTDETACVARFVAKGRSFSVADIRAMVGEQYKIMRAVAPIHHVLQAGGQVEVSTTPFFHPILPLLIDTDRATIDRPGTAYPRRFAHPEDADAQVRLAVESYRRWFGRSPRGMWPAEGAVSQPVIPFFARYGAQWIATDAGVLARSGRWGYRAYDPEILCRPYRAEEGEDRVAVFFRDTQLSDEIGFRYHAYEDYDRAAEDFLQEIRDRFVRSLTGGEDRVLTVILDGENAWGAYREDARPFLRALYQRLEGDAEIQTVTLAEYIEGNPLRAVAAHPVADQTKVYDLFTGSWIDESGSAPGVDLGTWIGEEEENRAWDLLGQTREVLRERGAKQEDAPEAFRSLYIAEGSDWFWWFGEDQDSGHDEEFDDLFRTHLKNVYRGVGVAPPPDLERHIVPHAVVWTFALPISSVDARDRLTVLTNCPGKLTWRIDDGELRTAELAAVGGVMGGVHRRQLTLGPFGVEARLVRFRFQCTHPGCDCKDACCSGGEWEVQVRPARAERVNERDDVARLSGNIAERKGGTDR
jgi:alpha-amylase/alpha-mannosidase (GH57 family)